MYFIVATSQTSIARSKTDDKMISQAKSILDNASKVKAPTCLTNPERYAELLDRYRRE